MSGTDIAYGTPDAGRYAAAEESNGRREGISLPSCGATLLLCDPRTELAYIYTVQYYTCPVQVASHRKDLIAGLEQEIDRLSDQVNGSAILLREPPTRLLGRARY
eukprot:1051884-Rhodomonas_salina.5